MSISVNKTLVCLKMIEFLNYFIPKKKKNRKYQKRCYSGQSSCINVGCSKSKLHYLKEAAL